MASGGGHTGFSQPEGFCSSKGHGFLLGSSRTHWVCFRVPQFEGSRDRSWRRKTENVTKCWGHGLGSWQAESTCAGAGNPGG